jgi:hypothetical protein
MMAAMDLDKDDRIDLSEFLVGLRIFAHVLQDHGLAGLAETLPAEQLADPSVVKTIDRLNARTSAMLEGLQKQIDANEKKEQKEEEAEVVEEAPKGSSDAEPTTGAEKDASEGVKAKQ